MTKILLVEDDKEINRLIDDCLSAQKYCIIPVFDGITALSRAKVEKDISLILLDLMLPFQSGDIVLKKIREFSDIPVIILSAKDTTQTKIDVIRMGADDYITKPFDLDELSARIEAVLRRTQKNAGNTSKIIRLGEIILNTEANTVSVNENSLDLTSKEYYILELMIKNPKKLFSKANLFESVWNEPYFGDDSTIKVHISNLRSKIRQYSDKEYIETVWAMGYRIKENY